MSAFGAWWRGWRHLNHRGALYIWANVLWAVLTLPVITAPAAWAALARLSYIAFREPTVTMDEFWHGFRANLRPGLVLGVVNLIVVVVNVTNLIAYWFAPGPGPALMRVVWTLALLVWFTLQFYAWPLYFAMERPSLRGALRNAAVLMLGNPLFVLISWALMAIVVAFSVAFPVAWLLITGSLLVAVSNSLVLDRLQAAGYQTDVARQDTLPSDGGMYADIEG